MLKWLDRLFCSHSLIKKSYPVEGKEGVSLLRMECIRGCGYVSGGIEVGKAKGFDWSAKRNADSISVVGTEQTQSVYLAM